MTPLPANLAQTVREWKDPAELYWTVKHGIKMSGMPAWEFRLTDNELWAVVSFLTTLPNISPSEYRGIIQTRAAAQSVAAPPAVEPMPGQGLSRGNGARGKVALQHACVTCHMIPGVVGAQFPVGPSLAGIANRKYLAGMLPNTREAMIRWLCAPQIIAPGSAMPNLDVTARDANDIAAYLETLH